MNKKKYGIIGTIIAVILLLAISYAFFSYNREGEKQSQIIAGSIYLESNDKGDIELSDMYPMSDEDGIEKGAKYQLNIRGHNESNKDMYYGVYLNQGEDVEGKIRLKDDEIKVYLTQTVNEETTVVYGPGTLKDFDNKLIHANVINQKTNRDEEVSIDYELTVWIDEKVMISDTVKEVEGKRIYTKEEFENAYATVVPTVVGDFSEKNVNLEVNATGTLMTSGTSYEIGKDYLTTLFTNENVKVRISSKKEVEKFVITNAVTNEVIEKTPVTLEGESVVEVEYTESGSYVYYGVYSDGTTSTIDTYNIKIDKDIPTFVMQDGGTYNVENINAYYKIENTLTNIKEDNDYEVMYALVAKGEEVSEYNKIELSEANKIVTNVKSGLWDLVVRVIDEAGKEKIDRKTYTISYTAEIINNNSDVTLNRTTQKLVMGQPINYLEELPVISHKDFIGYATDAKGNNIITDTTKVGNNIDKIYAVYKEYGLLVKPTSNNCLNVTYNGKSQVLTKDADEGFEYSNNTGINAGSYTITASLKEGFIWSDDSTGDVTITCNITKRDVTYKADDAEVTYTGSSLSKNTASITSGSLAEGHTATVGVSGTITNAGTATNTLNSVVIKDDNGVDVTSNYNVTMQNGTLTVNKATPTITLTEKTGNNYTGGAISANEATTNSDGEITYTYYTGANCSGTTLSGAPTDAGTYSVKATVSATNNYESATSSCVSHTITYSNYTITLDDGTGTTTSGTEALYGRANEGLYLDSGYTKKMTTTTNPITIPTKTGYTFGGYYTSENGAGTQLIDATGKITSSFTNSLISSNTTLYAKWTAKPLKIYYNVNGGTLTKETNGTYTADSSGFVLKNGSAYVQTVSAGSQTGTSGLWNPDYAEEMHITKTGYGPKSGSEWNINASGTGTSYNDSTVYTYDTLIENAIEQPDYYRLNLYVNWTPNTYTVTYNGNKFATSPSQTINGVTITYDPATSYLTLNGTPTGNIGIMRLAETFTSGEKYISTLTYISGSRTYSGTVTFTNEVQNANKANLSTRNYKSNGLPSSGTNTAELDISELGASDGKYLYTWMYFSEPSSVTFTNYKVKVNITKVETKIVTYDSTYGTLGATPTRYGYTFAGWYTAESGGTQVTSSTKVTTAGNHTLYAHWTAKPIHVFYNVNGGTVTETTTGGTYTTNASNFVQKNGSLVYNSIAYGSQLGSDGLQNYNNADYMNITKTGYTGRSSTPWNSKANGTGVKYSQSTQYTYNQLSSDPNIIEFDTYMALYLYVDWVPNTYTVTYNGNKFSTFPSLSLNGITATYDPSTSYLTLNGTPTGNLTLMQLAETFTSGEKYKITLTYVSGSYTTNASLTLATEIHDASNAYLSTRNYKALTLPKSGTVSSELTITELDASLGKYFVNTLWISDRTTTSFSNYVMKVNITKVDTKTVTYGNTYGTLGDTPLRHGYNFAGWYTAESGGTQVISSTTVTNTSNHTLYAHWTEKPIRVYLNTNGGTMGSSTSTNTFTKDSNGYVLVNSGSYYQTVNISGTIDIANYNNSTYINILKTGYTAKSGAEWNTKADGTGTSYNHNTVYNYNNVLTNATDMGTYYRLNLYVNWTPNKYTVQFNRNVGNSNFFPMDVNEWTNHTTSLGTGYVVLSSSTSRAHSSFNVLQGANMSVTIPAGYKVEIVETDNSDKTILYWDSAWISNTGTSNKVVTKTLSSTTTKISILVAKNDNSAITPSAAASSGIIIDLNKGFTYDSQYGTLPTPTRYGYIFAGWFTAASGGTQIASSTKVTTASNHTLYARWTSSLISVSIPSNSLCVSKTYNGSAQTLTSATSGTGYTLSGYSQTNAGTHTITASLTSGYKWSDGTTGTKTFSCSIDKRAVTYTADSATKAADGTALTAQSATLTSGSLVSGHTATFSITGSQIDVGSSTNTLNSVTIKSGSTDVSSNYNITKKNGTLTVVDGTAPSVTFTTNGNTTSAKSQSTKVTVTDASSTISTMKYLWTQTNGASASGGTTFTSGTTISKTSGNGTWYLCIYAKDSAGNEINTCSKYFEFDNTAPTITAGNFCALKGSSMAPLDFASVTDDNTVTLTASPSTLTTTNLGSTSVTFTATDEAGNKATKTVTASVYTKLIDLGTKTSGEGLYKDSLDDARYIYKGPNPSNYVKYNGSSNWRILSIEEDGTYKIVYMGTDKSSAFNSANSGTATFTGTTMNTYLNTTFYNTLDATAKGMIQKNKFYYGTVGVSRTATTKISEIYDLERASNVSLNVGLMTLTDFLRASTYSSCTDNTTVANSSGGSNSYCRNDNWLYTNGSTFWTFGRFSATQMWNISTTGGYTYADGLTGSKVVRPVVHLTSDVVFIGGSGTSSSPYVIDTDCAGTVPIPELKSCSIVHDSANSVFKANVNGGSGSFQYAWNGGSYQDSKKLEQSVPTATNNKISLSVTAKDKKTNKTVSCSSTCTFSGWSSRGLYYFNYNANYSKTAAEADNATWYRVCNSGVLPTVCVQNGVNTGCYACTEYGRSLTCS